MSEEHEPPSHARRWWPWVAAALLLYVLSVGPVIYLERKHAISFRLRPWVHFVYKPVFWLANKSPFSGTLAAYTNWWYEFAGGGDPFYVRPASSELPGPDPFASPPSTPAGPAPSAAPKPPG